MQPVRSIFMVLFILLMLLTTGYAVDLKVLRRLVGKLRFFLFFSGNFHQMCINNYGKNYYKEVFPICYCYHLDLLRMRPEQ